MTPSEEAIPPDLAERLAENDAAFAAGAGKAMGRFHAPDARFMLLFNEDIIGRDAVAEAFQELADLYEIVAYEPERRHVYRAGDRVVILGRALVVRRRRRDGQLEHEHLRIVEVWRQDPDDGGWYEERLLTSRFAETEVVEAGTGGRG